MTLAHAPSDQNLFLQPGQIIEHRRQRYAIVQCLDVQTILIRHLVTGSVERVPLSAINPPVDANELPGQVMPDLLDIPDDDWKVAQRRYEIIQPLLALHPYKQNRTVIEARAAEFELHASTLYRWMATYQNSKKIISLMPKTRKDKGSYKLSPEVEVVLQEVIENFYLTTQRRSIQSTCNEVMRLCRERELDAPHYNTVRNRILERTQFVRLARRLGRKTAENKLRPLKGEFPGADYPLSVVQIDHTQFDIILVDEHQRQPLGRPWVTLALDIRTRMVAGYYLSFDNPSALAVGMCLINVILPKNDTLARFNLDARWPIQGIPKTIHLDNAKEFHGLMLERACQQYGINIDYRPKGTPHMGGHVERANETLNALIHELPGTTFHHPKDRGEYRSAENAALTLPEFEKILLTFITRIYHERLHQGIQTTPLKRHELDTLGTAQRPGIGLMVPDVDPQRLRYDFLPFFEHTVQNYGILHKHLHYYADVLKPWIDAPDPKHEKRKRQFLTRYDPRDMSVVYFYDPQLKQHFPIPYRDSSREASVSLWEFRAVTKQLREAGRESVNEDTIFAALGELRKLEENAKLATKRQRKQRHNREHHTKVHEQGQERPSAASLEAASQTAAEEQTPALPLELDGFDDVEVDFND